MNRRGGRGHGQRPVDSEAVFSTPRPSGFGRGTYIINGSNGNGTNVPGQRVNSPSRTVTNTNAPSTNTHPANGINPTPPIQVPLQSPSSSPSIAPSSWLPMALTNPIIDQLLKDTKIKELVSNPKQTADPKDLIARIVTIENEMSKQSNDMPALEANIKGILEHIEKKQQLLKAMMFAKEAKENEIKKLNEQRLQIFKELCSKNSVRPPEVLIPKLVPSASSPSTNPVGNNSPSMAAANSRIDSPQNGRIPSPASSSGSDTSNNPSNGPKSVPQTLLEKAEAAKRKRVAANETPTVTSGVRRPIKVTSTKKRRETEVGQGDDDVGASTSKTTIEVVKDEPMEAEDTTATDVPTLPELPSAIDIVMQLNHDTSETSSQQPTVEPNQVPNSDSLAPEPSLQQLADQPIEPQPAAEVPSTSSPPATVPNVDTPTPTVPGTSTSTSTAQPKVSPSKDVIRKPGPASKTKNLPPMRPSKNVLDPTPFSIKPEPLNVYPGEEEDQDQVADQEPEQRRSQEVVFGDEDDGNEMSGILNALTK